MPEPAAPASPDASLRAPGAPPAPPSHPSRRQRLLAVALDLALGVAALAGTSATAALWLLLRTDGGAVDVGRGDAVLALAVSLAAVPAWTAWLAVDSMTAGATFGQRRAGVRLAGPVPQRGARPLLHPLGAASWAWFAVVAATATIPVLPLLLWAVTALVLGAGIVSTAMLLRDPGARALHDRVAGTRLERA